MRRARWTAFSLGLALIAVSAAAFIASLWMVSYRGPLPDERSFYLANGVFAWYDGPIYAPRGWNSGDFQGLRRLRWWPENFWAWYPVTGRDGVSRSQLTWLNVPVWIGFVFGTALSAVVWRWPGPPLFSVHTHTPGACSACGYDMAGVRGSTCPECGQTRTPATAPPSPAPSCRP